MNLCFYCGQPTDLPGDRLCAECIFEPVIDTNYQPKKDPEK